MNSGFCECGCGERTTIARRDDARTGRVKGEPVRFRPGHMHRTLGPTMDTSGYVLVRAEGHPRAILGRVLEHIIVAERVIGHLLPVGVTVHHVNEDKTDNRPGNLAVLQSQSEHVALHARLRVLRAGGNPWTDRLCCYCHIAKDQSAFYELAGGQRSSACKDCSRKRALARHHAKAEGA